MDEIGRQRQFEEQFLTQMRAKAATLVRGSFPADGVRFDRMPEGSDSVRDTLRRIGRHDADLLSSLPGRQTLQMTFRNNVLGGLFKTVKSRVRVQVLVGLEDLIQERQPGPIGRDQVLDALARYEVLPKGQRPTGVVLASPTGFTEEAEALVTSYGPPTVILMGGREDGGWDVTMPEAVEKSPWAKLFELETQDDLLNRMMYHLDRSADLVDSRGVSIEELSEKLGLDRERTQQMIRRATRANSRLMTVNFEGRTHVCRTPLVEEGSSMGLWSRIRKLLRMKPTVAERVRALTEQRVKLEQQRLEFDRRIESLEAEEVETVKKGAAATTAVEKKQLAGKLVRVRRELGRNRTQAQMLTQQIDVLGTHVHHITLKERGKKIDLPSTEELTAEAAEAEQMLAELSANSEMVAGIEVTAEAAGMSDEEEAILAEFEAAAGTEAAEPEPKKSKQASAGPSRAETPPAPPARERPASDEQKKGESARPEIG
jgi:hypothetical protein